MARYDNSISHQKREAAYQALDSGETILAQALLKDLAKQARNRREDAALEEAELEFELGNLAESEVRWVEAAEHYVRSAELFPSVEPLLRATQLALMSGNYSESLRLSEKLVEHARAVCTDEHLCRALDRQGAVLRQLGKLSEAEAAYREAIDVAEKNKNMDHLQFAAHLGHLGLVLDARGRYGNAAKYIRKALKIFDATVGNKSPIYATTLGNLAMVLEAQNRFEEAKELYLEALAIDLETIGDRHPDYANRLGNVAALYLRQGKFEDAERYCQSAMEIEAETIGDDHPEYSRNLQMLSLIREYQGRMDEARHCAKRALANLESVLPAEHPKVENLRQRVTVLEARIP